MFLKHITIHFFKTGNIFQHIHFFYCHFDILILCVILCVLLAEREAKKKVTKMVPKGTSEYQAAWITDSGEESVSIYLF